MQSKKRKRKPSSSASATPRSGRLVGSSVSALPAPASASAVKLQLEMTVPKGSTREAIREAYDQWEETGEAPHGFTVKIVEWNTSRGAQSYQWSPRLRRLLRSSESVIIRP